LNPEAKTCWDGWGNSYLVQWCLDSFMVQHVTGSAGVGYTPTDPIKESVIARSPHNKVIQGDWPRHANRILPDARNDWHRKGKLRFEVILFGDNHTEAYRFPDDLLDHVWDPPNPANAFW
jgi:hypothetical protein